MTFMQRVREVWQGWNVVPDCPSCKGTGEAVGMDDYTYWKGQVVRVCFQCKGSGKV